MIRKSPKVESDSTRNGFGKGIIKAGTSQDVWVVTADLGGSTCVNKFRDKFPERFVQVGVAEQNLVTVASGIASMNKVVFATSFAVFSPGRNWEQIRTTICYNDQPVIIVGSHTGLGVGEDGATHQALEDISLMRTLPNMNVVVPCDSLQAEKAAIALAKNRSPAYLRLNRQKSPLITKSTTPFKLGEAQMFREGKDLVIFSCGPIINEVIKAAEELKNKKISVAVVNIHTIKPLDQKTIAKYVNKCQKFLVVEDHQVNGGLGSAISECLINNPAQGEIIGVENVFGESGKAEDLYWKYGLTSEKITNKALNLIKQKNKKDYTKKSVKQSKKKTKVLINAPETKQFLMCDGQKIKNLKELSLIMKNVNEEVFKHHVTNNKNDFANWIQHVLKEKELSSQLKKIKTKQKTQKLIDAYLKDF